VPRGPRIDLSGLTYHVTAHALDNAALFRDDHDRDAAVQFLAEEARRTGWICVEYAIMTTHYHVVLILQKPGLSSGFHRFNSRYAKYFNQRHRRRGHVFEGRFRDRIVESEAHRLELARYIAHNATRAKMCTSPEDYPWCGYGAIVGVHGADPIVDVEEALAPFGGSQRSYRQFVEETDPRIRRCLTRVRHRGSS